MVTSHVQAMPMKRYLFLGEVKNFDLEGVVRASLNRRTGKLICGCQKPSCSKNDIVVCLTVDEKDILLNTIWSYSCLGNIPRKVPNDGITRHMISWME